MNKSFTSANVRLTVTEKINGKGTRVFLKVLPWFYPTLDCINEALPAPDSFETITLPEEEGSAEIITPVYEDSILDFVQTAINRAVIGIARSRDAADNEVPTDWSTLLESAGGSTFMAQKKVWRTGYLEYLQSQKFSETKQHTYMSYIESKVILALDDSRKKAVVAMLNAYEESIDDSGKAAVSSVLKSFANALSVTAEAEEF